MTELDQIRAELARSNRRIASCLRRLDHLSHSLRTPPRGELEKAPPGLASPAPPGGADPHEGTSP